MAVLGVLVFAVLASAALAAGKLATLTATLSGGEVVPPPGDLDGTGTALITIDRKAEQVCFEIDTENVATPFTGGHIHEGPVGETGRARVLLFGDTDNPDPRGCAVRIDPDTTPFKNVQELLKDMERNPQNYYVDIHNFEFPDQGAVRGQLRTAGA